MYLNFKLFFHKLTHYEYWSWIYFYLPILPYWVYLAIKTKSFTFFTATNLNIEYGGFYGESKDDILKQINKEYLPISFYVSIEENIQNIKINFDNNKLFFPVICKPDIGGRGVMVEKIDNEDALFLYHKTVTRNYIIQEFIDYTIELGVFYVRMPNQKLGFVTSVTGKKFMSIIGNGKNTIKELMLDNIRFAYQLKTMQQKLGIGINKVLLLGEQLTLEPIGNHCRGTQFLNCNNLINKELTDVFNKISLPINGFYFGRYDLKVKSIEDLYKGINIKILELNGASSEPGHIYDSSVGLFKAYKTILQHWNFLADIAILNMKQGVKPTSFKEIIWAFKKYAI